jgi:hypothetical protein
VDLGASVAVAPVAAGRHGDVGSRASVPSSIPRSAAVHVEERNLYARIQRGHPHPVETGESPAADVVRRTRRRGSGWTIGARAL